MAGILIREFLILFFDLGDEWYTEFLKFTLPVFLTFNQVKGGRSEHYEGLTYRLRSITTPPMLE